MFWQILKKPHIFRFTNSSPYKSAKNEINHTHHKQTWWIIWFLWFFTHSISYVLYIPFVFDRIRSLFFPLPIYIFTVPDLIRCANSKIYASSTEEEKTKSKSEGEVKTAREKANKETVILVLVWHNSLIHTNAKKRRTSGRQNNSSILSHGETIQWFALFKQWNVHGSKSMFSCKLTEFLVSVADDNRQYDASSSFVSIVNEQYPKTHIFAMVLRHINHS